MRGGTLYSFIKSKGSDETGTLVCREAVPGEGEGGDLGHRPPERTLNQTAAESSAERAYKISLKSYRVILSNENTHKPKYASV